MKLKTAIRILESLPAELGFVKAEAGEHDGLLSVTIETHFGDGPTGPTAQEVSELLTKLGNFEVGSFSHDGGGFLQLRIELWEDDVK